MPRLSHSTPRYRHHKATGLAVVTISGRDHYLGPWKSKASKIEYDRLIGEWLAAGRRDPNATADQITITELLARYWKFAKQHYRKHGKPTDELDNMKYAARPLKRLYGHTLAAEFGPLALKAIQQHLIGDGLSRTVINHRVNRIKRIMKWATSEELIPATVIHALSSVQGLQRGRTAARETDPVLPVADDVIDATLPHMPPVVADLVRFQRLTGCRPTEACIVRPCDIDRTSDVWVYRPATHKGEHHAKDRTIFIGPKCQDVVRPYLLRPATDYCFTPGEAEAQRRAALSEARKTPLSCGNRPGTNRRTKPQRTTGSHYTRVSYARAISRACDLAFPASNPLCRREDETAKQWNDRLSKSQRDQLKQWQKDHRWSPNQLRHTAATEVRKQFGLEAAQTLLGHSQADVTQVYAERDHALAAKVARQIG